MYGLKNVRNRRTDSLSRVAWDRLESLLAIYYRGQGYRVDHVGTGATNARFDGGIDLKLHKDDQYIVVQCKHWNAKQVPHNDVHQLLGIMVNEGATGAILVTSGEFTAYARESAAKQSRVQLIDGEALREMIGPIPEPAGLSDTLSSSTGSIAAHVGDRLLRAAEDRIRGNTRGQRRSGFVAETVGSLLLMKVVLPLAFAAVVAVVAFGGIKRVITRMQPAAAPEITGSILPAPKAAPNQPVTAMPGGQGDAMPGRRDPDPCHELIDWQSGTYIDHCAKAKPRKPPSAAEQRELQRKADEAMKVLEASTPEV